jgi:TolA-binding protein
VAQLPLSRVEAAVFQDFVTRGRSRLAYAAYANGVKAFGEKHWKRASSEFQRSLTYLPNPPHEASLRYHLGVSLMHLGSYQEAAVELERALAGDAESVVSSEIRYHLAGIYEQLGRRDKARLAYLAFLKAHPGSALANSARRKLKLLK